MGKGKPTRGTVPYRYHTVQDFVVIRHITYHWCYNIIYMPRFLNEQDFVGFTIYLMQDIKSNILIALDQQEHNDYFRDSRRYKIK